MKEIVTSGIDYKTDLKDFPDDSRALFELLASEADDLSAVEQQMYKNKFYQGDPGFFFLLSLRIKCFRFIPVKSHNSSNIKLLFFSGARRYL